MDEYIQKSVHTLCNFLYYSYCKMKRLKGLHLYRISFTKGLSLISYSVLVSFDNQQKEYRMAYSLKYREYYIELWLGFNMEFSIKSNFDEILLSNYPKKQNKYGKIVNFIQETRIYNIKTFSMFLYTKKKRPSEFTFVSSCKSMGKKPDRNEDAYFLTPSAIGVADGIGGLFNEFGISSKDFSTELMQKCRDIINEGILGFDCKKIVEKALQSMTNGGSSTYLLALISKNKLLISNMGDCGLLLYRTYNNSMKLVFQTSAKQYSFNTPFQVCKSFSPLQLSRRDIRFTNKTINDSFRSIDSDEYCITIHENDIIIIGSDGLFDNVYPEEITKIIKSQVTMNTSDINNQIFEFALKRASGSEPTPFEQRMKHKKLDWNGGKRDDITVLVASLKSKE